MSSKDEKNDDVVVRSDDDVFEFLDWFRGENEKLDRVLFDGVKNMKL